MSLHKHPQSNNYLYTLTKTQFRQNILYDSFPLEVVPFSLANKINIFYMIHFRIRILLSTLFFSPSLSSTQSPLLTLRDCFI